MPETTTFTTEDTSFTLARLDALAAAFAHEPAISALIPLARAATRRADMWAGYVSGASGGDADEEYRAFELADAALDDATAALIAALAGEVDDGDG